MGDSGQFSSTADKTWDPSLYDQKHSFVWKYGAEMIDLLAPRQGERILDIGCGTGRLTHLIAQRGADVVGLDRSPEMIRQARQTFPELKLVIGDARNFRFAHPFDAVFSNAALHWINEPELVIGCVAAALRPGGRFVAEFGGKGNLDAFRVAIRFALDQTGLPALRDHRRYYPSIGDYTTLLERAGLTATYAALYERPTALEEGPNGARLWLDMFETNLLAQIPSRQKPEFLRRFEDCLRPKHFRDGIWFADYVRIRVIAHRPVDTSTPRSVQLEV